MSTPRFNYYYLHPVDLKSVHVIKYKKYILCTQTFIHVLTFIGIVMLPIVKQRNIKSLHN